MSIEQTPPSPKLLTISLPKAPSSTCVIPASFELESVEEDQVPRAASATSDSTFCIASKDACDGNDAEEGGDLTHNSEPGSTDATFCVASNDASDLDAMDSTFSKDGRGYEAAKAPLPTTFSVLSSLGSYSPLAVTTSKPAVQQESRVPLSYANFVDIPADLAKPSHDASMPSSVENSFVDDGAGTGSNQAFGLNSTVVLSRPTFNVFASSNADEDDKRRTFVIPSIDDNKENATTAKAPAPVAMVSPMTSSVVDKAKKVKKALSRPMASTSNLRAILDIRPAAPKFRLAEVFLKPRLVF